VDEAAEATGEGATETPLPNPMGSMPSRTTPRALTMGLPFPLPRPIRLQEFRDQRRPLTPLKKVAPA